MEKQLQEKQKQINETDSKMSMISVYVDQLEERLASFAVARRDITVREKECDKLVNRSVVMEEELRSVKVEVENMKVEKIEMKNLIDLLIQERMELQEERKKLSNEKEKLIFESKALREELDILNDNFLRLESSAETTQKQLDEANTIIKSQEEALDSMEAQMQSQANEIVQKSANTTLTLQQEIQRLVEDNHNAMGMIRNLELMLEQLESELEETREVIRKKSMFDDNVNIFVQPPPPPPPSDLHIFPREYEENMHPFEHAAKESTTELLQQSDATSQEEQTVCDSSGGNSLDTIGEMHLHEAVPNDSNQEQMIENLSIAGTTNVDEGLHISESETLIEDPTPGAFEQNDLEYQETIKDDVSSLSDDNQEVFSDLEREHVTSGLVLNQRNQALGYEGIHEISFDDEEQLINDAYDSHYTELDQSEPELPNDFDNDNSSMDFVTTEKEDPTSSRKRRVPFRKFRKGFSKVTGIHGFFTKPSISAKSA